MEVILEDRCTREYYITRNSLTYFLVLQARVIPVLEIVVALIIPHIMLEFEKFFGGSKDTFIKMTYVL